MTCMGRKVEYHSPAKHPEQGDAMSPEMMDKMVEEAAGKQSGTYRGMRQDMRPMQMDMPRDKPPQGALDYLKSLMPGRKK